MAGGIAARCVAYTGRTHKQRRQAMGNLWRITWRYSNRADYSMIESGDFTTALHADLRGGKRLRYQAQNVLSITATPVNGHGQSWEWLNPDADDANPRQHVVDAGAMGV